MTIGPISYPVKLPPLQTNMPNMYVPVSKMADQDNSIFLAPNGNKASKQVAFGDYEQKIAAQNNRVIKHEVAHQRDSGAQASGSPVYETKIDKDGRKIITGGHQNVKLPGEVDPNSPLDVIKKVIEAARLTIKGAEAPKSFDQLSSADERIAQQGRQILEKTENLKTKRLDTQNQFGIRLDEKTSAQAIAQNKQDRPNQAQGKQAFMGQKLNLIG